MARAVIVGVDPGITTGIAILDGNGSVADIWKQRNAGMGEIVRHVLKFGKPLIVATDVRPVPRRVKAVAAKFGSRVFEPRRSMLVAEKKKLVVTYLANSAGIDRHEADALAAAAKAYHKYKPLFDRVESCLGERRQDMLKDVVEQLLTGRSPNIADAIDKIEKERMGK